MRSRNLNYHEEYQAMLRDLSAYQEAGISLTLSGRPSSAREVAYACTVREHGSYMRDYIPDGDGRLREIRFDKVRTG